MGNEEERNTTRKRKARHGQIISENILRREENKHHGKKTA